MVKDPNYIFRLYMAIGEYKQAASTAILIASQEQKEGNYKVAHGILFETHQDLSTHKIEIPQELQRNLLLLHSYVLVKRLVAAGDHMQAARMLIRVAKSISKFPQHMVQILTSTVIECQRAGLKRSSFEYASMLMRREYRDDVDARYRKKIEGIVRRPPAKEEDEAMAGCPFCDFMIPATDLDCPSCKNTLPYCAATGNHMLVDDWAQCPSCRFPCNYTPFVEQVRGGSACAMCAETPQLAAVKTLDPAQVRKLLLKQDGDSNGDGDNNGDGDENGVGDENRPVSPPRRAAVKANW